MRILVTGARGFAGKNIVANLENIRDGLDKTREVRIDRVDAVDVTETEEQVSGYCAEADFVFHFAGVNRKPETGEAALLTDEAFFEEGNVASLDKVLCALKSAGNRCPVMLASSIQAGLSGRFKDSVYGKTKREAEELLFAYHEETGVPVYVYRLPNLFGKWGRPDYNSVVATFCHRIARGEPVCMDNPETELTLLYIDDLKEVMIGLLEGRVQRDPSDERFCVAEPVYRVRLREIKALLDGFYELNETGMLPELPAGSFSKKLYATYLSFLPKERIAFPVSVHTDERGVFAELLKTEANGQFSVNIARPGTTRGIHWHNSKSEIFIVVSGTGLIRERQIDSDDVIEYRVSGEELRAVQMLPGYTHSITNLSDAEDLITVMWANECFDAAHPDTYFMEVDLPKERTDGYN